MIDNVKLLRIVSLLLNVALHESLTSANLNLNLITLLPLNFTRSNENFGASIGFPVSFLSIIKVLMGLIITPIVVVDVRVDAPSLILTLLLLDSGKRAIDLNCIILGLDSWLIVFHEFNSSLDGDLSVRISRDLSFILQLLNTIVVSSIVSFLNVIIRSHFDELKLLFHLLLQEGCLRWFAILLLESMK